MKNELSTNIQKTNFNTNDLIEISKRVAGSGLLGSRDENQIFTLMMLAYKDGTNPVQASMDYHIIQGRPALSSQASLVRFQKAGGKIKYITRSDTECTIEFSHEQAGSLTITWNMERARQAGLNLNKQNWKQYPRQMLAARCIAEGVRALYPACLDGLYLVEEVQDFDKPYNSNKKNIVDTQAESVDSQYNEQNDTYIIDDNYQYEIVPSGANKGKLWKDCDIGTLNKALDYYTNKQPNENYIKVITPILEEKLSICREGKDDGRKWADMTIAELEDYYKKYDSGQLIGFAEERKNYIQAIINEKRAIENKENNKVETPKVEVNEDENPFEMSEEEEKAWENDMNNNTDEGFFE